MKTALFSLLFWGILSSTFAQQPPYPPSPVPDRIVLTWQTDPATSMAVTWRTDTSVGEGLAEIALADASPDFTDKASQLRAKTEKLETEAYTAHFHSINFTQLQPDMRYAYRVGSEGNWSEWFQFRTASQEPQPFTFLYFGDAQNDLKSMWSRTVREAFITEPKADFMLHAGDLVNVGNNDNEWGEWFYAGGWMFGMMPSVATPGNHEYPRIDDKRQLSIQWKPTFTLPENGPEGLEETVYYLDYQGMRMVSLNSQAMMIDDAVMKTQSEWLDQTLAASEQKWKIVTHHHPVYSSGAGRDNEEMRNLLQPIYEKYQVDLVLQGHDHTYGRGRNIPTGQKVKEGPVYVVSVSGPKMYPHSFDPSMERVASNTQLYQTVRIAGDTLEYRAYTAIGKLYDAFDLLKKADGTNTFVDRVPSGVPERTELPSRYRDRFSEEEMKAYQERFNEFKKRRAKEK